MDIQSKASSFVRGVTGMIRGDLRPFALTVEQVEKLLYCDGRSIDEISVSRDVYPAVARQLGRHETAVSRSALRVANAIWEYGDKAVWHQILGRDFLKKPSPSNIIFFLAIYLHTGKPVFSSEPIPMLSL